MAEQRRKGLFFGQMFKNDLGLSENIKFVTILRNHHMSVCKECLNDTPVYNTLLRSGMYDSYYDMCCEYNLCY